MVFHAKADPRQIEFTPQDMQHLSSIHPFTLNEKNTSNGPICWVTLIPTSKIIMNEFLSGRIQENQLLSLTHSDTPFESIYLCSALTLPEYRKKGITLEIAVNAIQNICKDSKIEYLFAWPFSMEGRKLCKKIAQQTNIPIQFFEYQK